MCYWGWITFMECSTPTQKHRALFASFHEGVLERAPNRAADTLVELVESCGTYMGDFDSPEHFKCTKCSNGTEGWKAVQERKKNFKSAILIREEVQDITKRGRSAEEEGAEGSKRVKQ